MDIDATLTGDITETGKVWEFPMRRHACTTPAVFNGMAFVSDLGRQVYCLNADTGKALWSHSMKGEVWSSILVADGKVYVGSGGSDFSILEAKPVKKVLATIRLDSVSPQPAGAAAWTSALAVAAAEQELAGQGRILLRPSGTEPLIRVMVEGDDPVKVEAIAQRLADLVRELI